MSAHDDRDQNGFLGRWIKRKAQARERTEETQDETPEAQAALEKTASEKPQAGEGVRPGEPDAPAFDISQLPKLEDISAETSLADFMRKEVPAALRNAALKRAWALDPAIRDYVNPAREYAYDWNVPDGVPGNGPIEAASEAIRKVAEAIQSKLPDETLELSETTQEEPEEREDPSAEPSETPSPVRLSDARNIDPPREAVGKSNESKAGEGAVEPREAPEKTAERPRRRHGGAAPT